MTEIFPTITCSICRNNKTVARSADSPTLRHWHVISYPNDCHCPDCATQPQSAKPTATPSDNRWGSKIERYYQAALKLGEFSTPDLKNEGVPDYYRAGSFVWSLVKSGKLEKIGKARFKVIKPSE